MNEKDFSVRTFFLVSNFHTYGVQHAMLSYLNKKRAKAVCFLNHPLHGITKDSMSTIEQFHASQKRYKRIVTRRPGPEILQYAGDVFLTLRTGLRLTSPVDVYVGFNSINTISGIVLKLLGKVRFVITYSHSYKENRYENAVLNGLYKIVDSIAVRYSDSVWGLSDRLKTIRKAQGVPGEKIVVAYDGVDTKLIRPTKISQSRRFLLVFVGLVNQLNGLELVIEALPSLLKWNKRIRLLVIGEGEELANIKKRVSFLKIEQAVRFLGIQPIESLARILPKHGIGMATYKPLPNSTLKTTDPMKTKLYMAAGLPIISTDLYATAHEIADHKLGVLVDYKISDVVAAIRLLTREPIYKRYSANCSSFAKKYDWSTIFDMAFSRVHP